MRNPIQIEPDTTLYINKEGIELTQYVPEFKGTGLYILPSHTILITPKDQVPVIWRRDWEDTDMFIVSIWHCHFQDTILAYSDIPTRVDL